MNRLHAVIYKKLNVKFFILITFHFYKKKITNEGSLSLQVTFIQNNIPNFYFNTKDSGGNCDIFEVE